MAAKSTEGWFFEKVGAGGLNAQRLVTAGGCESPGFRVRRGSAETLYLEALWM